MCLAIYKPATTAPDWGSYFNGYESNPHSWGFAVVKDGRIFMCHGLTTFADFKKAFTPYAECQAIIHYRWATHGGKTIDNCHPFKVADDLAVIHNGIIEIKCNVDEDRSDTWHFTELVLKPMHERDQEFFLRSDVVFTQELAHRGNKFCFLRADGTYCIWGEEDGHWETDGHWYSNTGYRYRRWYTASTLRTEVTANGERFLVPSHESLAPAYEDEPVCSSRELTLDLDRDACQLIEQGDAVLLQDPYSGDTLTAEDPEEAYYSDKWNDLLDFGFSNACLREVRDLAGWWGIESLHDSVT